MNSKIIFAFNSENENEDIYEEFLIKKYCENNFEYDYIYCSEVPMKDNNIIIPIGSVEWCEKIYGNIKPNYYPEFLNEYFNRNINICTFNDVLNKISETDTKFFIKNIKSYKGIKCACVIDKKYFSLSTLEKEKRCIEFCKDSDNNYHYNCIMCNMYLGNDLVYCSDYIKFESEFRYYFIKGICIASTCYDIKNGNINDIINCLVPEFVCKWIVDNKYYGVIDMGIYDGKLTLIEVQHPYAVGWYPGNLICDYNLENAKLYINFCIEAHDYMMNTKIENNN